MSAGAGTRGGTPFSPRAVLGLLLFGALAFLAALYLIGAGKTGGTDQDGGSHGASVGLTGYAALYRMLDGAGHEVSTVREESQLAQRNLLILTPPRSIDGKELARIVDQRRHTGPTIVVTPKWSSMRVEGIPGIKAKPGWVVLGAAVPPDWPDFLDDISVSVGEVKGAPQWQGGGLSGALPDGKQVLSGSGKRLEPIVTGADGQILAAYYNDGGIHPGLEEMAGTPDERLGDEDSLYPLVLVFEPDLLNNYGMGDRTRAALAQRIVSAALQDEDLPIAFDLTMNGLGAQRNLLTLAFTPPFLAATLCLILAALVVAWRALRRFGPPLAAQPVFAFGKRQLAVNVAALIQRSRRLHLLGAPYAAIERGRVAHLLGIRPHADPAIAEAEIDQLLVRRGLDGPGFAETAGALRRAKGSHELLRRAHALKQIERKLVR